MPKRRKRRSRAEWESLVAEWRAGGLSQQEFARRRGVAPTTLSWWTCRLRREGRETGPALVPVRVVDSGALPVDLVVRRPTPRYVSAAHFLEHVDHMDQVETEPSQVLAR